MKNFRFFMAAAIITFFFVLAAIPQNHPPLSTEQSSAVISPSAQPGAAIPHSAQSSSVSPHSAQPSAAAPDHLSVRPSPSEQSLFDNANRERSKEDLPPLKWNALLASAARHHAELMAQHSAISHQFPGEPALVQRITAVGARFSTVAENIAAGQDAGDIHYGWMHSPGHRANILDPKLTALGVAVVEARGRLFAVQDFSVAVAELNFDEQEKQVSALLKENGIAVANQTQDARKECANEGVPAGNRTIAIIRFEAPDLSKLPEGLERKIHNQAFHRAEVGACPPMQEMNFPVYRIAVMLF
jgi:uncharacterized protein YkwD